ncbi:MAG TPA: alpha-amylase family glycosyl hydrolase, partial [Polyangiaceae bacterium]|nr:alpha-amylase family glycosyl hydrolase [Polyangiaceae bacterium]
MPSINVQFEYLVGLRGHGFTGATLTGDWDAQGRKSASWHDQPMERFTAEDGCIGFRTVVSFDDSQLTETFHWGVQLRSERFANTVWGIATEVNEGTSSACNRVFQLNSQLAVQRYYLTHCRRLGANKFWQDGQIAGVRFAVWAPNASQVQLVRGCVESGYVYDDGTGAVATFPMRRDTEGIWYCDPTVDSTLADYAEFEHSPYMYRITRAGDTSGVKYRTDLYSRCQIGSGRSNPEDPKSPAWSGRRQDLDGAKSCSVVVDPERVVRVFRETNTECVSVFPETDWTDVELFWADEFVPDRPLPTRLDDLVIYELHVDGLGVARDPADRGRLEDALALLDYLVELGVNCIELLPFSEYEGWANWGYATSHYAAIEYAGGGRDQFKHFVKQCHRRGIAVIFDVVYNHFTPDGERAEWMYDSVEHDQNVYYWYEGRPGDYPAFDAARPEQRGHGGYVDNMSTGYAPRYSEEMVRKLFISSAAALVNEFHVDGFRVDQTTSIHAYAVVHADGRPASAARAFGA